MHRFIAAQGRAKTSFIPLAVHLLHCTPHLPTLPLSPSKALLKLGQISLAAWRLQGVLLATCFDPAQLEAIRALHKQHVEVR